MISWPKELISDIARRHVVIFLGSGISKHSVNSEGISPKLWAEFLNSTQAELSVEAVVLAKKLIGRGDYLTACEIIKNDIGATRFNRLLIAEYLTQAFKPASIHKLIFSLDSRIVATPNFDKIYETFANHEANGSIRVKYHYETDIAEAIRSSDRLILKIHGTIDTPTRMVFTRREYAEARNKYSSFYNILEALALTHTFLFLGCGVNDPDVRLLLEDHFFRHSFTGPHFLVLPKSELRKQEIAVIEDSMNLKILTYEKTRNHEKLLMSLEDLITKVDAERQSLKQSANW